MAKKPKEDREEEPRTKIEAEKMYADLMTPPGKKNKKPPKEEGAVSRFGKYLKGKAGEMGENYKSVDKYYKEKWKTKDLQEQIKKKKRQSKIARLKAEGRRLRDKKK